MAETKLYLAMAVWIQNNVDPEVSEVIDVQQYSPMYDGCDTCGYGADIGSIDIFYKTIDGTQRVYNYPADNMATLIGEL